MDLKSLIQQYLHEANLMQLATSRDNQPWVCNVWFVADKNMNIYWFSAISGRHSKELIKNKKIAASIVMPHTPQDIPRGIQLQGTAEELSEKEEINTVYALFKERGFDIRTIRTMINSKDKPYRFYQLHPTLFVLFDVLHFPNNARQEYTPNVKKS